MLLRCLGKHKMNAGRQTWVPARVSNRERMLYFDEHRLAAGRHRAGQCLSRFSRPLASSSRSPLAQLGPWTVCDGFRVEGIAPCQGTSPGHGPSLVGQTMLLARLVLNRSAQPLSQAYHGLVLTTAQHSISRHDAWIPGIPPQSLEVSWMPTAVSSALAGGIPGTGGISGGAGGSASAERSTGLPGAAVGGGSAAETSTGLAGPPGALLRGWVCTWPPCPDAVPNHEADHDMVFGLEMLLRTKRCSRI